MEVPVEGIKFNQSEFPKVVVDSDVFLSEDGYIMPYKKVLPEGRTWEDKEYLFPFSMEELVLNKALVQNPGWESPN